VTIPESQLATWSKQGSTSKSAATYQSIRSALTGIDTNRFGTLRIFLQGSYANDTNIYAESDVDVVVEFEDVYYPDVTQLSDNDRRLYEGQRIPGRFTLEQARDHVLAVLRDYYDPARVRPGTKSIKVNGGQDRYPADVIVACEHKYYFSYSSPANYSGNTGIIFLDFAGNRIVNHPRKHIENGVVKEKATSNYKSVVRIFKNLKSKLVNDAVLDSKMAPSYFVECFLYNAPNRLYSHQTYAEDVAAILNYLRAEESHWQSWLCQNEVTWMFGQASTQWSLDSAKTFLNCCISAWNNW
jgi:hypothetical protein